VTPEVSQPSPLNKSHPEITKKVGENHRESWIHFRYTNETGLGPLLWSQRHDGRLDHFVNFRVKNMPTIEENLKMETSFGVGSTLTPAAWR
jgi:hypothetical protein